MDFRSVIPIALNMSFHNGSDRGGDEVWPGKSPPIEEHFANVVGQSIPVPDPEMTKLVSAEK